MTIKGSIVKTGATAMTPTAGIDLTFTEDGMVVPGGVHVSDASQSDFRTRKNLTVKHKLPTYSGGVYSKDRKSMVYVEPMILADGRTVFNLIRIEREVHPEATAATALNLNMIGAQLLSDADFNGFWTGGSLS